MARVCVRHPFERSDNLCGHCGHEFCRDCLVFPNGPAKQPLCVQCALAAGGVRSTAKHHPTMSRRDLKRRLKERSNEEKALARVERQPVEIPAIANPFSPGWAMSSDELPGNLSSPHDAGTVVPPPPPPPPPDTASPFSDPARNGAWIPANEPAAPPRTWADQTPPPPPPPSVAPTLADLLPTVAPVAAPVTAATERKPSEFPLTWDNRQTDDDGDDRDKRRTLPLLRRRESTDDDGTEASEMMAWLDEVFAPRDQ